MVIHPVIHVFCRMRPNEFGTSDQTVKLVNVDKTRTNVKANLLSRPGTRAARPPWWSKAQPGGDRTGGGQI